MPVIVNNMLVRNLAAGITYRILDQVTAEEIGKEDPWPWVVLINTDLSKKPMPIAVPEEVLLEHLGAGAWRAVEDDQGSIDLNTLTDAERKVLDERWKILRQALRSGVNLYDAKARAELARQFAEERIITRPVLYQILRLYWTRASGRQSLVPRYQNCGAPGQARVPTSQDRKAGRKRFIAPGRGIAMTQEHRRKMELGFDRARVGNDGRWLSKAFDQILITQYPKHVKVNPKTNRPIIENYNAVPTFEQFRYHWQQRYDYETRKRRRLRARNFEKLTKILSTGTLRDLRGPGSRYEIDATIVDAYVVSRYDPNQIIGRPTLYLVADQFSRMIVGYYIGLEPPCLVGAMLALWSCNIDKVSLCEKYGIHITPEQWPIGYMPHHVLGDRGEMISPQVEHLSAGFCIDFENARPYCGEAKSIVERTFGSTQCTFVPYVPGHVDREFLGRGERPPQLDAVLNLDHLTRVLLASIVTHNNHVIRDYPLTPDQIVEGVESIPTVLWEWGRKHLRSEIRHFTDEHLARYLWPQSKVKLDRKGLHYYRGLWYYGTKLREQPWFVQALNERQEFSARMHPHDLTQMLLISNEGRGSMLPVPITRRSERFAQLTLSELYALDTRKRQANAEGGYRVQPTRVQMTDIMLTEVGDAKARAKAFRDPTLPNKTRMKAIRENKKAELAGMNTDAMYGHFGPDDAANLDRPEPPEPLQVEQDTNDQVAQLLAGSRPEST